MKKAIMILSLIIVLLPLVGCVDLADKAEWEFDYEYSQIKEIKIVYCKELGEYYTIRNIHRSYREDLYGDIECLDMQRYYADVASPKGECFMIIYDDGNYDLISRAESKKVRYNSESKEWEYHDSYLQCYDASEFYILIDRYLDNSIETEEWQPMSTEPIDVSSFLKD